MILFALTGPDRYELLITAILQAIESNTQNAEKYESLITELNQSLTQRCVIPYTGNQLHRQGGEGTAALHTAQAGAHCITGNTTAGARPIQRIPQNVESARGCHLHYPVSKQPAGYDYMRESNH